MVGLGRRRNVVAALLSYQTWTANRMIPRFLPKKSVTGRLRTSHPLRVVSLIDSTFPDGCHGAAGIVKSGDDT